MGEDTKTKANRPDNSNRGFRLNGSNTRPTNKISSQNHKSKILELEDDTFNCGHRDNAARFDSADEAISIYMVHTYKWGVYVGTAITHKFFCCNTARVLKQRSWTKFNMPDRVIKKSNKWGVKTRREVRSMERILSSRIGRMRNMSGILRMTSTI